MGKIVCHFRRVGKHATLESIEIIPAEDAAIQPLTFPGSLLEDSCLDTNLLGESIRGKLARVYDAAALERLRAGACKRPYYSQPSARWPPTPRGGIDAGIGGLPPCIRLN